MSIAQEIGLGVRCEECGVFLQDDAPGHPRKCDECEPSKEAQSRSRNRRERQRRLAREGKTRRGKNAG